MHNAHKVQSALFVQLTLCHLLALVVALLVSDLISWLTFTLYLHTLAHQVVCTFKAKW